MRRQCGRPGCSSVATVTFSFDATNCVVWLDTLADGNTARAGDLCTRHADLMSPPRGWERVDRRPPRPEPQPFAAAPRHPEPVAARPAPSKPTRAKRRSRVEQPAASATPPLPEPAWLPRNASADDLDGVLDVSTPLLSRAFGGARPVDATDDDTD